MKRKINYAQKARRQRRTLTIFITIGIILCVYFSMGALADNTEKTTTVYVTAGDTLWSICEENLPANEDLRSYIYKVKRLNKMETSNIYAGQEIILPNS